MGVPAVPGVSCDQRSVYWLTARAARMMQQTTIHDLKNLILSYHSLITIETVEEERVWALLSDVAGEARLPLYQWSQSRGLGLGVHPPLAETQEPLAALRHISASEGEAIYQLNDLARHLDQTAVARELRELVQKLTATRSAVVITGDPIEMPHDLAAWPSDTLFSFPARMSCARWCVRSWNRWNPVYGWRWTSIATKPSGS